MADDQTLDFAASLRQARRGAGLSQEDLAERAGLSARGISDLERGVIRAPRRDTLDMLANALELSRDERRRWEHLRRHTVAQARADERAGALQERVVHPVSQVVAEAGAQPLLVGRERDKQHLRHSIAEMLTGRGRTVLIGGEAG